MAAWTGFTDDDLRKMKKTSQEDERKPQVKRKARQPKATAQRPKINTSESQPVENLPPQAQLSSQRSKEEQKQTATGQHSNNTNDEKMEKYKSDGNMPQSDDEVKDVKEATELNEEQGLSAEKENAVKFQQQQKVIQEANKQKRALLSKAIDERRKKAKAESTKLIKIQRELSQMDTLLNLDVGIIRDKIEIASLDYVQAQKRYEKAEKEFIESKMDLFEKGESKERLTEHLYTIIHQNEVRKAKKLVELMEQLAMEVSAEEMEMAVPSIPLLTNFNTVTTLHQPGHRKREPEAGNQGNDTRGQASDTTGKDPTNAKLNDTPHPMPTAPGAKVESGAASPGSQVVVESQVVSSQMSGGLRGVSHEDDHKDVNQNKLSSEKSDKDTNQSSSPTPTVENVGNVVLDLSSAAQVNQQSEEKSSIPSDSGPPVPAAPATTTTSAALSDHDQLSSLPSSSSEQSQSPPQEEKPVKGWSLPFM